MLSKLQGRRQDRRQGRDGQRRRPFGIELSTAAATRFKKAGFDLVYDKTYPLGTQDMQPILKDAMASNADTFVAFSYPPDTIGHHRRRARC